jgi:hypothetical protein
MTVLYPQKIKIKDNIVFRRMSGQSERFAPGLISSLLQHGGRYFVLMTYGRDRSFIEIDKGVFDTITRGSTKIKGTFPVSPAQLPHASIDETAAFIAELAKKDSPSPTDEELWKRAIRAAKRLSLKKNKAYPSRWANSWAVRWYKKRGGKFTGKKPTKTDVKESHDFIKGDIHHAKKFK